MQSSIRNAASTKQSSTCGNTTLPLEIKAPGQLKLDLHKPATNHGQTLRVWLDIRTTYPSYPWRKPHIQLFQGFLEAFFGYLLLHGYETY